MQEAVKKEAGFVPKPILRSVRFGRNKSNYDRAKKTRARAFSYTRVSFSAIPMIHEYVVLTKNEIKRAKIKAENEKRREERKKEKNGKKPHKGSSAGNGSPESQKSGGNHGKRFRRKHYNKKMDELHPSMMTETKNKSKKKSMQDKNKASARVKQMKYVSRLNKELIKKNLLRAGQKRNKKNASRKCSCCGCKNLIKNLWCQFFLFMASSMLLYVMWHYAKQYIRNKTAKKNEFRRSNRYSYNTNRRDRKPWVKIEQPFCKAPITAKYNDINEIRTKWYNYPCISQNKTFTIASNNFKETRRRKHLLYLDGRRLELGGILNSQGQIRTDGSRVFSVTLDGLSGGVHNATVALEETKGAVGNMVPANTGVRVLYSHFIIFQVERKFWIRSLKMSILKPVWGEVSSSNRIEYESSSFRVPDDGVVYLQYLGKVLKVQLALGSVNLNGLVPGKNKLIAGMMDRNGNKIGETDSVEWTHYRPGDKKPSSPVKTKKGNKKKKKKKKKKKSKKGKNVEEDKQQVEKKQDLPSSAGGFTFDRSKRKKQKQLKELENMNVIKGPVSITTDADKKKVKKKKKSRKKKKRKKKAKSQQEL